MCACVLCSTLDERKPLCTLSANFAVLSGIKVKCFGEPALDRDRVIQVLNDDNTNRLFAFTRDALEYRTYFAI